MDVSHQQPDKGGYIQDNFQKAAVRFVEWNVPCADVKHIYTVCKSCDLLEPPSIAAASELLIF